MAPVTTTGLRVHYAHPMRIVIAGAHGQIGLRLVTLLTARGDEVLGLIRDPDHAAELTAAGATPVVCDLETASTDDVTAAVGSVDVAVFAAGAGPGSGAERKLRMDRDGAIKLLEASQAAGVPRFLIISSVGAENPPAGDDVFSVYLRAKAEADQAVQVSDRDWTIARPGRLPTEPGQGRLRIDLQPFRGEVPRDDVAALLDRLLKETRAVRI